MPDRKSERSEFITRALAVIKNNRYRWRKYVGDLKIRREHSLIDLYGVRGKVWKDKEHGLVFLPLSCRLTENNCYRVNAGNLETI